MWSLFSGYTTYIILYILVRSKQRRTITVKYRARKQWLIDGIRILILLWKPNQHFAGGRKPSFRQISIRHFASITIIIEYSNTPILGIRTVAGVADELKKNQPFTRSSRQRQHVNAVFELFQRYDFAQLNLKRVLLSRVSISGRKIAA